MIDPTLLEQGAGALPDVPDDRDYKVESLGAAAPVDWSIPFSVPEPRDRNQMGADCCVAEACSFYHETIRPAFYASVRDLFARIALDGYGAYIRDGIMAIVKQGQADKDEVVDPAMPNRINMRDKTGVTPDKELDTKELDGFVCGKDIESVAQTIRDYRGCVFGVNMTNEGWHDEIHPRPPLPGEKVFGHALYGMGYRTIDGTKYIVAKSSFGRADGSSDGAHHLIPEGYFLAGQTFSPWTLIPRTINTMDISQYQDHLVQDSSQTGAFGIVIDNVIRVAKKERLPELIATYIIRGSRGVTSLGADMWNNATKQDF